MSKPTDDKKDELREKICTLGGMCTGPWDIPHRCSNLHCEHCGLCNVTEELIEIIEGEL